MTTSRLLPFALVLLAATLAACDFPGGTKEDPPELQTRILEVRVAPDPVAVGDTATFTAIIEDSLDASFRFTWGIDGEPPKVTDRNYFQWIADISPGQYSFSVTADNDTPGAVAPTREFSVEVIP